MARTRHLTGRFERPNRWRRRGALAAFVFVVVVVAAYLFLTSPRRLAALAGGLLEGITGAEVRIGHAEFGLDGIIHLRDVQFLAPQMPGDEKRIFFADEVLIRHELMSLIGGKFVARSLTFSQPTLYITEDSASGSFNYDYLRRDDDESDTRTMPSELPEVFIRQGSIVRGEVEGGNYTPLFRFNVEGKLTEEGTNKDAYYFSLRQFDGGTEAAPLRGRLNLRTMNVEVELDRFVVETRQGDMLPSRLRRWWQMMQPEGEFSAIRMSYDPEAQGFAAVLEVKDTALTLPYFNREQSTGGDASTDPPHQFRLTNVSGRFEIINDRISIVNLQGMLEGIHYTFNGQIDGLGRDAPFHLSLRTREFEIPEDPQFLTALPPAVRVGFDRFSPSGTFKLALQVDRRSGGELTYRGAVDMRGARFTYSKFAYPLHDVAGRIAFDEELVEIREIVARGPTGAKITINGQIAPPDEQAAVHITIAARDVPFDEHVLAAINPKHHFIIKLFSDEAEFARLQELGLIQQDDIDNSDTPYFELGGTTDYDITITRLFGPQQPVRASVTMQMAGMNVLFKHWPYPIRATGGTLRIEPDHVLVDDITGEGLHGGGGVARGRIDMPRDDGTGTRRIVPDIDIEARDLPMDDLMLAAIPQPRDQWVRDLHLSGLVDARVKVFDDEAGKIDFRINTTLHQGHAQPFGGRYDLSQLQGDAVITKSAVTFSNIRGQHNDSNVVIDGTVESVDRQWRLALNLRGEDLRFEDPLLDLIPSDHQAAKTLADIYEQYAPVGRFNAALDYQRHSETGEQYALTLQPHEMAFDFRGKRIELTDTTGQLHVEPGEVELDRFAASFGTGSFIASGLITTGDQLFANLIFDAEAQSVDDTVRLLLPSPVITAVDGLSLDGTLALRGGRLKLRTATGDHAPPGDTAFSFSGDLHITDGKAEVGVPIRDMTGRLAIFAAKRSSERWPNLNLMLNAQQLRAADRLITPFDLRLASTSRPGVLEMIELNGSVYGGLLRGEGRIDLTQQAYLFQLVLLDAPLDPIIHPANYDDPQPSPPSPVQLADESQPLIIRPAQYAGDSMRHLLQTGRLSASLDIEAVMNRPDSRRGRGELEIRGARMYELPLAMAMLQILNLTAPASGAFDEANARFIVDGDNVLFDLVSITAPTIALSGDGFMRYSDRSLDLVMFSSNPQSPDLGALSDILNIMKDELLCVRVQGTLEEPKPQVINFRGIRESWRALFGGNRQTIAPVSSDNN